MTSGLCTMLSSAGQSWCDSVLAGGLWPRTFYFLSVGLVAQDGGTMIAAVYEVPVQGLGPRIQSSDGTGLDRRLSARTMVVQKRRSSASKTRGAGESQPVPQWLEIVSSHLFYFLGNNPLLIGAWPALQIGQDVVDPAPWE